MFKLMTASLGALLALMWSWVLTLDDPPEDPPDDGDPPEDPPADKPFKQFTSKKEHDDYLEAQLKERLARKDRKLQEEKEETERKAREDALKEQGEFKTIADQRQETIVSKDGTIAERDSTIERLEAELEALKPHRESNEARAKALMENVPDSVKELLSERDPLKQLEWIDKNPDLAGGVQENGKPKGSRATGKPARQQADTETEKQVRAEHRQVSRI